MCVTLQKGQSRELHLSILGLGFFSFLVKSTHLSEQLSMETGFLSSLQSGKAWSWLLKWPWRLENRIWYSTCLCIYLVLDTWHTTVLLTEKQEEQSFLHLSLSFLPILLLSTWFFLSTLTFSVLCYFSSFKLLYNYMLFSFFFFISSLCIFIIIIAKSLKWVSFLSWWVKLFGEVACDEWFPETLTWWSHGTINEG